MDKKTQPQSLQSFFRIPDKLFPSINTGRQDFFSLPLRTRSGAYIRKILAFTP